MIKNSPFFIVTALIAFFLCPYIHPAPPYDGGTGDYWDGVASADFSLGGAQSPAVSISSALNQTFKKGDTSSIVMSPITVIDAGTPLITTVTGIRIGIPAGFNMTWDTSIGTASITGSASGKVNTAVTYESNNKVLKINVIADFSANDLITISDLRFKNFTAYSQPAHLELQLVTTGGIYIFSDNKYISVGDQYGGGGEDYWAQNESLNFNLGGIPGPFISSDSNQVFAINQGPTNISTISVSAGSTPEIIASNDIRIRIPYGFNMKWDSSVSTVVINGTAAAKVATGVAYEDSDRILKIDVTADFIANEYITISGLKFKTFSATSFTDNLELDINNDGVAEAIDDKTIEIISISAPYAGGTGDYWDVVESSSYTLPVITNNSVASFSLSVPPVVNRWLPFSVRITARDSSGNITQNVGDNVLLEIDSGSISYSPAITNSEFTGAGETERNNVTLDTMGKRRLTARCQTNPDIKGTTDIEVGIAIKGGNIFWYDDKDYTGYTVWITNNTVINFDSRNKGQAIVLSAKNLIIDRSALITADGYGYAGGPAGSDGSGNTAGKGKAGAGNTGGGGAGHGGIGGQGGAAGGAGGGVYDDFKEPVEPGSGGGGSASASGGAGGGAIKIIISENTTQNGTISANSSKGNDGGAGGGGGGSGGAIWITTQNLFIDNSGLGIFRATGGNAGTGTSNSGGGGGGGIVSIWCPTRVPRKTGAPAYDLDDNKSPRNLIRIWKSTGGSGANSGDYAILYIKEYMGTMLETK